MTNIDIPVGNEDRNTMPELEQFEYDLDTDMLAVDKMTTDDNNALLVPVGGPKQRDITKELDQEMGLDNRDLEVEMDNLTLL